MVVGAMFSTEWISKLSDIPESVWNECFPEQEIMRSYALQQVYEQSNFEGVLFHYLAIKAPIKAPISELPNRGAKSEQIIALFPCFFFGVSLTDVAPRSVQSVVNRVRRFWPGFLKVKALVCGSPIATCDDLFGIQPNWREHTTDIVRVAFNAIEAFSQKARTNLIVVKEIRERYKVQLLKGLPESFIVAESPPTCFAYVGPKDGDDYIKSFRNRYRSNIKGYLNKFNKSDLRWELVSDFSDYAEKMCALYLNVLEHSAVKFETLTPDFFRVANEVLGDQSSALFCFSGDEIVAMELILQDKAMHPIYLGMDYRYIKDSGLYFNCLIRLLSEAEQRGSYLVELGQTSYDAKSNFGIKMESLFVAIKSNNGLINKLLRSFKSSLFPAYPPLRERNLFKNNEEHERQLDQSVLVEREGF